MKSFKPHKKSGSAPRGRGFHKGFSKGFKKREDGEGGERRFDKPFRKPGDKPFRKREDGEGGERRFDKPFRKHGDKPFRNREGSEGGERRFDKPFKKFGDKSFRKREEGEGGERRFDKPFRKHGDKPYKKFGDKPFRKREDSEGGERRFEKPFNKPFRKREDGEGGERRFDKPYKKFDKKFGDKQRRFDKPFRKQGGDRPQFEKAFNRPPREGGNRPHMDGEALFGLHAVRAAWLNAKRRIHRLWVTETAHDALTDAYQAADERNLERPEAVIVTKDQIEGWFPHAVHQGVVIDATPLPEISIEQLINNEPRVIIVLDQVTDPHNVGAILRSAAAFNAGGVIVTERNSPAVTGTLAKTASGAMDSVPLVHVSNIARALEQLREAGYWCVGLAEEGARTLDAIDLSGKTALAIGAEGDGLRRLTRERCDELAKLPTSETMPSLNASNAAAVGLYEILRQKKA